MTKIVAIAWVTLREALRQKLAVNLLAVRARCSSPRRSRISQLTFGEQYRIICEPRAHVVRRLFGTLIAVFLGAGLVARDVQRRTLYPILAKPVSRAAVPRSGRYLGLVTTLTLNLAVMAATTLVVLAIYRGGFGFLGRRRSAPPSSRSPRSSRSSAPSRPLLELHEPDARGDLHALARRRRPPLARRVPFWARARSPAPSALRRPEPRRARPQGRDGLRERSRRPTSACGSLYAALYARTALALAAAVFSRRDLR